MKKTIISLVSIALISPVFASAAVGYGGGGGGGGASGGYYRATNTTTSNQSEKLEQLQKLINQLREQQATKKPAGEVLGATDFVFTKTLKLGSRGDEVVQLQSRLRSEGFFKNPTDTGYFGPLTVSAVKEYQKAHPEIGAVTGNVGVQTRASLNKK